MAAAPRGVEAHSLLGGSYPLMTDAVEKVGATLTTRNNRIAQAGFLNRSCAFDARLESILLEDPLKIFFRQHRPIADLMLLRKSEATARGAIKPLERRGQNFQIAPAPA